MHIGDKMNNSIQIDTGDGAASMKVGLEWGEELSFCCEFIPAEHREWLGQVLQRQVNAMLLRNRHDAVESHKRLFNQFLAPRTLRAYEDENKK
jgi:hypothetical protein